jgi:hypothetical protein
MKRGVEPQKGACICVRACVRVVWGMCGGDTLSDIRAVLHPAFTTAVRHFAVGRGAEALWGVLWA